MEVILMWFAFIIGVLLINLFLAIAARRSYIRQRRRNAIRRALGFTNLYNQLD